MRSFAKLADVSKLKLKFFVFCLRITNIKTLHWEFQCNYVNFENILEIPLTLIKQTCLTCSIWKVQVRTWCGPCFKSVERQQNLSDRSYRRKYRKKKANFDERS